MARGEPAKRGERGPGLAIGASLVTAALAAVVLILFATREEAPPTPTPPPTPAYLPFAGADIALGRLGTRACAAYDVASITLDLEARGYVAAGAWRREPSAVAVDPVELEGSCGVIAILSPSSTLSGITVGGVPVGVSCSTMIATLALCSRTPVEIAARGPVDVRAFLMAGVTPDDVTRSGLAAEVVLAHLEAESLLGTHGWIPSEEVISVAASLTGGPGTVNVDPPITPTATGCIGWVLVAPSLSASTPTTWAAAGAATRTLSTDAGNGRSTLGGVGCRDPAGVLLSTSFALSSAAGAPSTPVFFRAYTPRPMSVGAPPPPRVRSGFTLRSVDVSHATLPASTPYAPAP